MRSMFSAVAIVLVPGLVQAADPPYLIGSASDLRGASQLVIHLTRECERGNMVQVVAVSTGGFGGITASDSGRVNIYQAGGGEWRNGSTKGVFLATTSPREPTNAGLRLPATITVNYANRGLWKAAIAACVPDLETTSGSADNKAGVSATDGAGPKINLQPSSKLLTLNEPLFVATVLSGDAADHWTESAGYTTLMTLHNRNTLNLAYQIIAGANPTPYLATNAAARPWSAGNRSYKTRIKR